MIQCNAGHFFDESKHSGCPYCGIPIDLGTPRPTVPVTGPLAPAAADSAKTIPLRPAAAAQTAPTPPPGATRRLVEEELGIDPVVGWLVCIDGPDRGRDYRIRSENNFLGRDSSNHIAIAGDDTISRQKHATVAFEPNERAFWLLPGGGTGLTYRNGKMVVAPVQLQARDIVRMGKTSLMLVPFVDTDFSWR